MRKKWNKKFENYFVLKRFSKSYWNTLIFFQCGSRIRIHIKIKWILSTGLVTVAKRQDIMQKRTIKQLLFCQVLTRSVRVYNMYITGYTVHVLSCINGCTMYIVQARFRLHPMKPMYSRSVCSGSAWGVKTVCK